MKVCVLGATGKSGRRIVRALLERGHCVTALVRDVTKAVELEGPRVEEVCYADVDALAKAMHGHDAVINAAGYVADGDSYIKLVRRITLAAERALGPDGRFWLFGGAAVLGVPGSSLMTLDLPGVPAVYKAHRANLIAVTATKLDWSMLCPGPMIEAPDGKATEGLIVSTDVWPFPRPAFTHLLPPPAMSIAFNNGIPRMTIYYEDAACVIADNLGKAGPLSRHRVGVALPRNERRNKAHTRRQPVRSRRAQAPDNALRAGSP